MAGARWWHRRPLVPHLAETLDRLGGAHRHHGSRPLDDRDGHLPGEIGPAVPAAEDLQVVAAHQPGEFHLRKPPLQRPQRVEGVMRAEIALDVHHDDAGMARHDPRAAHALGERRHAVHGLSGFCGVTSHQT